MVGEWSRYRAIDAAAVAAAMYGSARSMKKGVHRYTFAEMRKFAVSVTT
jgi:hypothetical protein